MDIPRNTKIIFFAICFLALSGFGYFYYVDTTKPGAYDGFAQCISNSGAKFYGAYWCPHCQKQKAEFGKSAKLLPYIECDTLTKKEKEAAQTKIKQAIADGKLKEGDDPATVGIFTSSEACTVNHIKSYPTWIFADGSQVSGEQTFSDLASKTGCVVPFGTENQISHTTGATTSVTK